MGNLHALELLLRLFLCEANGEQIEFPAIGKSSMSETNLMNYYSLGELIDAYNASLKPAEAGFAVDPAVARIRDAIAHGRLLSASPGFPLALYKFRRPMSKMVPLEFAVVATEAWLETSRQAERAQMANVSNCAKGRRYQSIG